MAGLTRKTSISFGLGGSTSNFGQFGSKQAGLPQTTQDPAVIQELAAWQEGWTLAVVSGDKAAYIQDMNGFCLVDSYQITYLFQMGIPEWDNGTLYFTGSIVQTAATGQWFRSLQGGVPGSGSGQSGNAPPSGASNAFWHWLNPPTSLDGGLTVGAIPLVSASGPATLVDSHLSDNGTDIVTSLPIKFPDNTVQSTAAVNNLVANQAVVTGSRGLNTIFHNTGTRPLFVSATLGLSGGGATAITDSSSTPTTSVASVSGSSTAPPTTDLFFIVLPGNYYKIATSGSVSLSIWTEWS
jgi:hypothetical protein